MGPLYISIFLNLQLGIFFLIFALPFNLNELFKWKIITSCLVFIFVFSLTYFFSYKFKYIWSILFSEIICYFHVYHFKHKLLEILQNKFQIFTISKKKYLLLHRKYHDDLLYVILNWYFSIIYDMMKYCKNWTLIRFIFSINVSIFLIMHIVLISLLGGLMKQEILCFFINSKANYLNSIF